MRAVILRNWPKLSHWKLIQDLVEGKVSRLFQEEKEWNIGWKCLSRPYPYPFKFFKVCVRQILLGPFWNSLSQIILQAKLHTLCKIHGQKDLLSINKRGCWKGSQKYFISIFCFAKKNSFTLYKANFRGCSMLYGSLKW